MAEQIGSEIIQIYEKLLRSGSTPEQREANAMICRMTQMELVPVLFQICAQSPTNEYQILSAMHIKMCIITNGLSNIPIENLNEYRRIALELLKTSKINVGKIQLLALLMTNADNATWKDLMDFAAELAGRDLFSTLAILESVINTMPPDCVVNNMELLISSIEAGLEAPDVPTTTRAVALLGRLSNGMPLDEAVKSRLREKLHRLFLMVLREQQVGLLEGVASDCLSFYRTENRDLLPFETILQPILEVLVRPDLTWEFQYLLYEIYELGFWFYDCSGLSLSDINQLICFERDFFIATLLRKEKDEIENLPFQTTILLLLKRIDKSERREYVFSFLEHLRSMNTIEANCFILEFVSEALYASQELFYNDLDRFFSWFVQALAYNNNVFRYCALKAMEPIINVFSEQINENLVEFFGLLRAYVDVNPELAFDFIINTLSVVTDDDPIFNEMRDLSFHILARNDQSSLLWERGMLILAASIKHSGVKAAESFNGIFTQLLAFVERMTSFESPQTLVFECLTSLTEACPKNVEGYLSGVVPKVIQGISSTSCADGQFDALGWLEALISCKVFPEEMFGPLWEVCHSMVDHPWCAILPSDLNAQRDFIAPCRALEVLSKIAIETLNPEHIQTVMNHVMVFIGTGNIVEHGFTCALQTLFSMMKFIVDDERVHVLGNHFLSLLASNNFPKETEILRVLREMIMYKGSAAFDGGPDRAKELLNLLSEKIQWRIEKDLCDDQTSFEPFLKEAIDVMIALARNGICITIPEVIEMFAPFQESDRVLMRKMILRVYAKVTQADQVSITLPWARAFLTNFRAYMNDQEVVAIAACKVVWAICRCQPIPQDILVLIPGLMDVLRERISVDSPPHHTRLNEFVGVTMTIIGGYHLGEKFPYDTCLDLILTCLPLKYNFNRYIDIIPFLSAIVRSVAPEHQQQIIQKFIAILADYPDPLDENCIVLTLANTIATYCPLDNPQNLAFFSSVLQGDDAKIALCQERIRQFRQQMPI